jgi:hypothetical protein
MRDDFIGVYHKALPDALCDFSLQMWDTAEKQGMIKSRLDQGQDESVAVDSQLYSAQMYIEHYTDKFYKPFMDYLQAAYDKYADKYAEALKGSSDEHKVYTAKMQKTMPAQGYHRWHYECGNKATSGRLLVYTAYMNDVEEGGETEFLYLGKRIKPEKGTIVIFPAGITHTHRGNPPLSGDKYIITGWFEF